MRPILKISRLIAIGFLLFTSISLVGQIDSTLVNNSPYGVIYNHLYYLQDDSYDKRRAAQSFPPNTENAEELAIQLKKVLDGKGYYIDINRLPEANNYVDSTTKESIYFLTDESQIIYVEKIGQAWYYSETTIEVVPDLFKEVYPFGSDFVKVLSGPFWELKVFGISMAKWIGLVALGLACILIFYFIHRVSKRLITSILKRRLELPEKLSKPISRMSSLIGWLIVTRFIAIILPFFELPVKTNVFLIKSVGILSIFFLIILITQVVKVVFQYFERVASRTENTMDDQLLLVLSKIIDIIIWSIGILYVLDYTGVNITALLAGVSIGGLAIALAAQDTVKNFFGSLVIFLDRPFKIGDWINFEDVDGVVEEVGVRSTRVRTFANSLVYVPNALLSDRVVNNMGLRKFRRFKTDIGVTYNTPPVKIDQFVKGIKQIIDQHPSTRKDSYEVHLNSFGASSVNILLYCFFRVDNWTQELSARHELLYAIMVLASDLGISFAFPSQSVYIESFNKEGQVAHEATSISLDQSLERINHYFDERRNGNTEDKYEPLGGDGGE